MSPNSSGRLRRPWALIGSRKVAAVRDRFRAELAGRDLHVLLAHGAQHVAGGQPARRDLVGVQPQMRIA
jgi:hypothetical protein